MKKLINRRLVQYLLPLVIWFLLLILPFIASTESNNNIPANMHRKFVTEMIASNFLLLCIFYIHTYFMYPLLNKNKKVVWYVLSLIILLGLYWLCWSCLKSGPPHGGGHFGRGMQPGQHFPKSPEMRGHQFRRGGGGPPLFIGILMPLVAILCSFCYRLMLDNRAKQQLLKERETVHLKSELNFLRSQISPHFMFNVLNNLVALARKKSDDLEPAIVNLSHLMRYMLYESDDHRVVLSREVEYIKSYINLQMLRFGNAVKTNVDISGDTDLYTIEPMLLIPFVENAFKHGTGMMEEAIISISLSVDEATRLMHFNVVNGVSTLDVSKDKSSGIGISNVRRRLAILYPEKHDLQIVSASSTFTVNLSIYLSN